MPNLSIKNVPESVVEKLRRLAAANHRSLQGELMVMVHRAVEAFPQQDKAGEESRIESGWKSIDDICEEHLKLRVKPIDEGPQAVEIIRQDRDRR